MSYNTNLLTMETILSFDHNVLNKYDITDFAFPSEILRMFLLQIHMNNMINKNAIIIGFAHN